MLDKPVIEYEVKIPDASSPLFKHAQAAHIT